METLLSRKKNRQSGFTLLEVLIAVFVLAFGLLAVAGLMSQLTVNTNNSRSGGMEVLLASEKLEDLNMRGLSDPYLTPGGDLTQDGITQNVVSGGTTYVVYYSDIIDVSSGADASANGDLVETTTWVDTNGNTQYRTITHSPKGQAADTTSTTKPVVTPDMLIFHRRWLIEKDPVLVAGGGAVTGVLRITIWIQLQPVAGALSGAAAVPFQTSLVRPYR